MTLKKVMIVETNEPDAQQGARSFAQINDVEIALLTPSTSLALQRIQQETPYLVVIDEHVQGWQAFCQQIKQQAPQIKIAVTTNTQNDQLGHEAKGVGADALLIKPLHQMQDELPNLFKDEQETSQDQQEAWQPEEFSVSSVFKTQTNNNIDTDINQQSSSEQMNPFANVQSQSNSGTQSLFGQSQQLQNSQFEQSMSSMQQPVNDLGQQSNQAKQQPFNQVQQQPLDGMSMFGQGQARPKMIVTVYSPKGGVGKTTMSLNIAVALRQLSIKHLGIQNAFNVGLVDFDVDFGDVAASLQLVPRGSVVDWPKSDDFNPNYVKNLFTFHEPSGVMILAGPERPEMEFLLNEEQAKRVVSGTHQMFDIVVVDMGYSIRKSSLMAMSMATHPLFITTPDTPSVRDMTRAQKSLNEHNIDLTKSQLIINRIPKRGRAPLNPQEVKRYIGLDVIGEVQEDPTVLDALSEGTPLTLKWKSPAALEIERMAHSLIEQYLPTDVVEKREGFFKRLFGGLF